MNSPRLSFFGSPPFWRAQEPGTSEWKSESEIQDFTISKGRVLHRDVESRMSPRAIKKYLQPFQELPNERTWRRGKDEARESSMEIWTRPSCLEDFVTTVAGPRSLTIDRTNSCSTVLGGIMAPEIDSNAENASTETVYEAKDMEEDKSQAEVAPGMGPQASHDDGGGLAVSSPVKITAAGINEATATSKSDLLKFSLKERSNLSPSLSSCLDPPISTMVDGLAAILPDSSFRDDTGDLGAFQCTPVVDFGDEQSDGKFRFESYRVSSTLQNKKRLTVEVPKFTCSGASSSSHPATKDGEQTMVDNPQNSLGTVRSTTDRDGQTEANPIPQGQMQGPSQTARLPGIAPNPSPGRQHQDCLHHICQDAYLEPEASPVTASDHSSPPASTTASPLSISHYADDSRLLVFDSLSHHVDAFPLPPVHNRNVASTCFAAPPGGRMYTDSFRDGGIDDRDSPDFPDSVENQVGPAGLVSSDYADDGFDDDYESSEMVFLEEQDADSSEDDIDPFVDQPDSPGLAGLQDPYQTRLYDHPTPRFLETIAEVPSPVSPERQIPQMKEKVGFDVKVMSLDNASHYQNLVSQIDHNRLSQLSDIDITNSFKISQSHDRLPLDDETQTHAKLIDSTGCLGINQACKHSSPDYEIVNAATTGGLESLLDDTEAQGDDGDESHHREDEDENHAQQAMDVRPVDALRPEIQRLRHHAVKEQITHHEQESPEEPKTEILTASTRIARCIKEPITSTSSLEQTCQTANLTVAANWSKESFEAATPRGGPLGSSAVVKPTRLQLAPLVRGLMNRHCNPERQITPSNEMLMSGQPDTAQDFETTSVADSSATLLSACPFHEMAESLIKDTKEKPQTQPGSASQTPDRTLSFDRLTPSRSSVNFTASKRCSQDSKNTDDKDKIDIKNNVWQDKANSPPRSTRSSRIISTASASTTQVDSNDLDALLCGAPLKSSTLRIRGDSNFSPADGRIEAISEAVENYDEEVAVPKASTLVIQENSGFDGNVCTTSTETLPKSRCSRVSSTELDKEESPMAEIKTPRDSLSNNSRNAAASGSLFMRMRSVFEAAAESRTVEQASAGIHSRYIHSGSGSLASSVRRLGITGIDLGGYVGQFGRGGTQEEKVGLLDGQDARDD